MHARAPRARVKISTRIFGLPMVKLVEIYQYVLSLLSTRRNFARGAEFFFVFSNLIRMKGKLGNQRQIVKMNNVNQCRSQNDNWEGTYSYIRVLLY
jgi:hypothetical protein